MTTEEVIKILSKHKTCHKTCDAECRLYQYRDKYCREEVAFNRAIEALEDKGYAEGGKR